MSHNPDWRAEFRRLLPVFGHRNWILIADAAFPAQTGAVEVLATGEDHLAVVREVLGTLAEARHVRPVVFLDVELNVLTDEMAPGADATRDALAGLLRGLSPTSVLHEQLLERLSQVARSYRILVLKTTGTVPYSTVFLELDCGYWTPQKEATLRQEMERLSFS